MAVNPDGDSIEKIVNFALITERQRNNMDANKNIHIFRLIHFDNLEETLKNGMYSKNSGHLIPNFVNIGDTTLIKQRETFTVRVNPPNGNLGDYIPF